MSAALNSTPLLYNRYELIESIAETDLSRIYKVKHSEDGNIYCLKVLKNESFSNSSELKLGTMREARILSTLKNDSIVQVKELLEENGDLCIVLDYVGGGDLSDLLNNQELSLTQILEIGSKISKGLGVLHSNGILHRDIKPENILVESFEPEIQIKIGDLGLAYDGENQSESFSGSINYVSPEQAGLVNWPLSAQSDLYSLGALLYELFAGRPPFVKESVSSILASHLSEDPEPPSAFNSSVPPILDRVVLKLLEKSPADRYRSADSLLSDLEFIKDRMLHSDPDPELELDRDKPKSLTFKKTFVGRVKEMNELNEALKAAQSGNISISLVSGVAGIGKSSLVREFENQALVKGAKFAYGKCYEFARTLPCYCMGEAFEDLLKRLARMDSDSRDLILRKIKDGVGDLSNDLIKITPSFGKYFEKSKDEKYLGEEKDRQRFFELIKRLLIALSHRGAPLVLLLDDLQWADQAVLDILVSLIEEQFSSSVMILGTYRSEEIHEGHPFKKVLDLADCHTEIKRIHLDPLSVDEGVDFIAESLSVDKNSIPKPLVDLQFKKSNGNALLMGELLKSLINEEIISLSENTVVFDEEAVNRINLPDSVVDIVLRRVNALESSFVDVVSQAAKIGVAFKFDELESICEVESEQLYEVLQELVNIQILKSDSRGEYAFFHDKISEACGELISEEKSRAVHSRILRYYESLNNQEKYIFELAEHSIRSNEQDKILFYCELAGDNAKQKHARSEAKEYYDQALRAAKASNSSNEIQINLRKKVADILILQGGFKEGREIYYEIFKTEDISSVEKAKCLAKVAECLQKEGDYSESRNTLIRSLSVLGEPIRESNLGLWIFYERLRYFYYFLLRTVFCIRVGEEDKLKWQAICQSLTHLWMVQLVHDMQPLIYVSHRFLSASMALGPSTELSLAHRNLALALANKVRPEMKSAIRHARKSVDVGRKVGADSSVASAMVGLAAINTWRGNAEEALIYCGRSHEMFLSVGNYWDLGNSIIFFFFNRLFLGELDEALAQANTLIELAAKTGSNGLKASGHTKAAEIHFYKGNNEQYTHNIMEALGTVKKYGLAFDHFQACKLKGQILLLQGEYQLARSSFSEALEILHSKGGSFFKGYLSLAYLGWIEAIVKDETYFLEFWDDPKSRIKIKKYLTETERAEKSLKELGHVYRVKALLFDRLSESKKAEYFFEKSLRVFKEQKRPLDTALCLLDWGLLSSTEKSQAIRLLLEALEIFKELEMPEFISKVETQLGHFGYVVDSSLVSQRETTNILETLLEIGSASTSSLDAIQQTSAILDKAVEIFKSERAFLFLSEFDSDELHYQLGRSSDKEDILEAVGYSTTVVNKVIETKNYLIVAGTEDGLMIGSKSAFAHNLLSIIAVPIIVKSKLLGVLYLDSKLEKRVYDEQDASVLFSMASHIGFAIHMRQMAEMEIKSQRLERSLELTGAVQALLLPKDDKFEYERISSKTYYEPADHSGGDWWWTMQNKDGSIIYLLGDVTGHGAGSAIVTGLVTGCIEAFERLRKTNDYLDPEELILVADSVVKATCGNQYVMSLLIIVVDPNTMELKVWNAGSPGLFLQDGNGARVIQKPGGLVGIGSGNIGKDCVTLSGNATIILFTDGFYEQPRSNGAMIGQRGLFRIFKKYTGLDPKEGISGIVSEVTDITLGVEQDDDMSCIYIRVSPNEL